MSGCNKASQSKHINRLTVVSTGGQKSVSPSFNSGNPSVYSLLRSAGVSSTFSHSANFSGLLEGKMPSLLEVKKEPNKWIPWSCQTHWNTTKDFYFSLVSFTSFRDPLLFTLSSNCSFFHVLTFRHPMRSRWRWTKLKQRKGGDLTPCSTSLSPHE